MPDRWRALSLGCAAAGGAGWLAFLLARPPSLSSLDWAVSLLLLAPLALVPLGLRLVAPEEPGSAGFLPWRAAVVLQLPAALALAVAFVLPKGPAAAALALPWAGVTADMALYGLLRLGRQGLRRVGFPAELAIGAGLIFPLVGAGWALFDRAAIVPLRFAPIVVLLTAVHFHYAGFALPLLTGLAARAVPGTAARAACLGVVLGVPLVAIGITASQLGSGSLLETLAAWTTALAGLLTAGLHLRLALRPAGEPLARALWAATGIALAAGMVLAALYGSRAYLSIAWLDYPRMWALHGTANGLGFGLCGLAAWNLAQRADPGRARTSSASR